MFALLKNSLLRLRTTTTPALVLALQGLATAAFFIPLIGFDYGFTPLFTKAVAFQLVVELMVILWLPLALADRRCRPDWRHPLVFTATVFVALAVILLPASVDPEQSFWSTAIRMNGVFALLHLWLWFLILTTVLRSPGSGDRLLVAVAVSAAVVDLLALHQAAAADAARVSATLDNPAFLGAFAALAFWLTVTAALRAASRTGRLALAALASLHLATIIVAASRASLLAIMLPPAIGGLCLFAKSRRRLVKNLALALPLLLLAGAVFGWSWLRLPTHARWADKNFPPSIRRVLEANFGEDRLSLWSIAWQGWRAKPLLGWGPENFQYVFDRFVEPVGRDWMFTSGWYDRPHNLFLEVLDNWGLVGTAAYAAVWIVALGLLWRRYRDGDGRAAAVAAGLGLVLFAQAVQSFFSFDVPSVAVLFWLALALVVDTAGRVPASAKPARPLPAHYLAGLLLMTPIAWYGSILPLTQIRSFSSAYAAFAAGEPSVEQFRASLYPRSPMAADLRLKLSELLNENRPFQGAAPLTWWPIVKLAAAENAQLAQNKLGSYKCALAAAVTNRLLAEYEPSAAATALKWARTAQQISPQRLKADQELGEIALAEDDPAAAVRFFSAALRRTLVRTQIGQLHFRLAQAEIRQDDFNRARQEMAAAWANGYDTRYDLRLLEPLAARLRSGQVAQEFLTYAGSISEPWADRLFVLKAEIVIYAKAGDAHAVAAGLDRLQVKDPLSADDLRRQVAPLLK